MRLSKKYLRKKRVSKKTLRKRGRKSILRKSSRRRGRKSLRRRVNKSLRGGTEQSNISVSNIKELMQEEEYKLSVKICDQWAEFLYNTITKNSNITTYDELYEELQHKNKSKFDTHFQTIDIENLIEAICEIIRTPDIQKIVILMEKTHDVNKFFANKKWTSAIWLYNFAQIPSSNSADFIGQTEEKFKFSNKPKLNEFLNDLHKMLNPK